MILGVIADDFTGAGDIALILSTAGMKTALLTTPDAVANCTADAGVVALKTRSIAPADAVAQSLAALARLRAAGCRQIVFKYCSTFDSTPAGNIGPVAEALAAELNATGVVVCPSFPANGRTVYQGHLFVEDVLLSESGMRDHPITPMTDGDIRRWLRRQTSGEVGHVPITIVREGGDAIEAALAREPGLVIVDAVVDDDLRAIGRAVRGAPLVTGGSAVAQGLPANFFGDGVAMASEPLSAANHGPALLLAGSCSQATNAQVARYASHRPTFAVDVERLLAGEPVFDEAREFAILHASNAPLIYSSADPDRTSRDGRAADTIEALFANLAVDAVEREVTRLIVAGGETSGAVVEALGLGELTTGVAIAPGVPALHSGSLSVALKSGNFGGPDFFTDALRVLGGEHE